MGGGKSQKGGNHGSIGRTLAHDILLRQSEKKEQLNRLSKKKEYSVYERTNLDDFTIAATQGLESYIARRGVSREVKKTDLNSQLYEFINFPDFLDDSQFPIIPIPRRSFIFTDEQKHFLSQSNKQRLFDLKSKSRRYYKRKNKKKVDMYMHGDVSRPFHGYYDKHMPNIPRSSGAIGGLGGVKTIGKSPRSRLESSTSRNNRAGDSVGTSRASSMSTRTQFKDANRSDSLSASYGYEEDEEQSDYDDHDYSDEPVEDNEEEPSDDDTSECSDTEDDREEYEVTEGEEEPESEGSGLGEELNFQDLDSGDDVAGGSDDVYRSTATPNNTCSTSLASSNSKVDTSTTASKVSTTYDASDAMYNNSGGAPSSSAGADTSGKYRYVDEYLSFLNQEYRNVDISKLTTQELEKMELKNFYKWRSLLNNLEATENSVLTPYEKNIDFWRQLWRVVEKSNLVLIVLDSRDPLFFRIKDLERYIKEVDETKQFMLVLNKADFLNESLRIQWAKYFKSKKVDYVFFSSLYNSTSTSNTATYTDTTSIKACDSHSSNDSNMSSKSGTGNNSNEGTSSTRECGKSSENGFDDELDYRIYNVELLLNKINKYKHKYFEDNKRNGTETDSFSNIDISATTSISNNNQDGSFDADDHLKGSKSRVKRYDSVSSRVGNEEYFVGFVGYPNVGKSSLINCLLEKTKVSVGVQPGKTKHMQTLKLHDTGITLCDCPGLIFPNLVSTKYHLLINNIVSSSHFKGNMILAVQLICNLIPIELCNKYDININDCLIATSGSNNSRTNRGGATANTVNCGGSSESDVGPDKELVHQLETRQKALFSFKVLELLCKNRNYISGGKGGQLDYTRASKLIINDFTQGNLLYCKCPPTVKSATTDSNSGNVIGGDKLDELYGCGTSNLDGVNGKSSIKSDIVDDNSHMDNERVDGSNVDVYRLDERSSCKDSTLDSRMNRLYIGGDKVKETTELDNADTALSSGGLDALNLTNTGGVGNFGTVGGNGGVRYVGKTITESRKDEENVNQWLKQQLNQESRVKMTKRKMRFLLKGKRSK